jgi:hypothetical protein
MVGDLFILMIWNIDNMKRTETWSFLNIIGFKLVLIVFGSLPTIVRTVYKVLNKFFYLFNKLITFYCLLGNFLLKLDVLNPLKHLIYFDLLPRISNFHNNYFLH